MSRRRAARSRQRLTTARRRDRNARPLQEPTPQINAAGLDCVRDAAGRCTEVRRCLAGLVDGPEDDDCLAPDRARAWSSPIYVDHLAGA
jgi:hypothetical protein